jgi:hypothetical protein
MSTKPKVDSVLNLMTLEGKWDSSINAMDFWEIAGPNTKMVGVAKNRRS